MPDETAVEIDEPDDWAHVEGLLQARTVTPVNQSLQKIKMLIVDVDGTLTDGGMYYSPEGDFLKKFNTRDAKGLALLSDKGIKIAIITSEDTPIVEARAKKLGIRFCFLGIRNKIMTIKKLCSDMDITFNEIAYIGDDLNDLECMKQVGFSACPADAIPEIRSISNYIAINKGGFGAVREICDYIRQNITFDNETG